MKEIQKYINSKIDFDKAMVPELEKVNEMENTIDELKKYLAYIKNKEMKRLYKEFNYNDYERRYNTDRKTVIGALIGNEEDIIKVLNSFARYENQFKEKLICIKTFSMLGSTIDKVIKKKNLLSNEKKKKLESNLNTINESHKDSKKNTITSNEENNGLKYTTTFNNKDSSIKEKNTINLIYSNVNTNKINQLANINKSSSKTTNKIKPSNYKSNKHINDIDSNTKNINLQNSLSNTNLDSNEYESITKNISKTIMKNTFYK